MSEMREHQIRRIVENDPEKNKVKTSVWRVYSRLLTYVWPHQKPLLYAALAMVGVALLNFVIPQFSRIAIDESIPAQDYSQLGWIAAGIAAAAVLLGYGNYVSSYMMSTVGQRTIYDIRNHLYRHIQELSLSFFENRRTGDLMSRVTNDVNTLQSLITSGVVEIVKDVLIFIVIFVYMFVADWQLTAVLAFTFPVMIVTTHKFAERIRGAYADVQKQAARVNNHLQETISSMKLIKSFSKEEYEMDRFADRNRSSMEANITAVRYWSSYAPIIEVMNYLGLAVILVFGSYRVIGGSLSVGELVAFLVYLRLVQQPIRRFTRIVNVIQQAAAASERIFEVLDTRAEVVEKADAVELPAITGRVRLEHVSFAYDGAMKVLQDVTLELEPGQTVALVGPSGAGKSSLVNLIVRFYDPQQGAVRFDGIDVRDVQVASLRRQIGIVSQEVLLLNGTIRENIAYGLEHADEEAVIQAARQANAHEFIMSFPDGYDTRIGERGIKLSGGQRQRISIARALVKNPRLLILDEATSSLDTESEHLIQEALERLMANRTSLVIAHRLSTIMKADRIIVLEQGRIVETGAHQQLLAMNGLYARLYQLQFPRGERKLDA